MSNDADFNRQQELEQSRRAWNAEAASFDEAPDHGLRDPNILNAWTNLLKRNLPSRENAAVNRALDVGCGTGSLSLVLAGFGYEVTGIDFSPEMIALAKTKADAALQTIDFHVMDAAFPQFPSQQFDVIVCRHLLWTLPEPPQVLQRWADLLKPGGRLIMIEGFWHTGVGLHAQQILDMLPDSLMNIVVEDLIDQPELWGQPMNDERYLIRADLRS